jgi:hypothetical protein
VRSDERRIARDCSYRGSACEKVECSKVRQTASLGKFILPRADDGSASIQVCGLPAPRLPLLLSANRRARSKQHNDGWLFGVRHDWSRCSLTTYPKERQTIDRTRPCAVRSFTKDAISWAPCLSEHPSPVAERAFSSCPVNLICILISSRLSVWKLSTTNSLGFPTMHSETR